VGVQLGMVDEGEGNEVVFDPSDVADGPGTGDVEDDVGDVGVVDVPCSSVGVVEVEPVSVDVVVVVEVCSGAGTDGGISSVGTQEGVGTVVCALPVAAVGDVVDAAADGGMGVEAAGC